MINSATLLDADLIRLVNALVILVLGIFLALGFSRLSVWLLRKVKWDKKITLRGGAGKEIQVEKIVGRFIFWFFIIAAIFIAVGEVSGIQAIVNFISAVDRYYIGMQSSLLIMFLFRILATFVLSLIFVFLWRKIKSWTESFAAWVDRYRQQRLKNLKIQDLEVLSRSRISRLIHAAIKYLSWLVYLFLTIIYISIIASIFPAARPLFSALLTPIWAEITKVFSAFIAWLPNLVNLILISLAGFYLTRLARYFFRELGKGSIHINGFYPEWAEPTYQLVRVLIIAITVVFAFPFIPGSSSPAFQGVSVFSWVAHFPWLHLGDREYHGRDRAHLHARLQHRRPGADRQHHRGYYQPLIAGHHCAHRQERRRHHTEQHRSGKPHR